MKIPTTDILHMDPVLVQSHHVRDFSPIKSIKNELRARGLIKSMEDDDGDECGGGTMTYAEYIAKLHDALLYTVDPQGVATMHVCGELYRSLPPIWEVIFGCLFTYESITAALAKAAFDPAVRSIFMICDSPGGRSFGAGDCAQDVRQSVKPTVAYGNGCIASAMLEVVSGATKIVCHPQSFVGSIGTLVQHVDYSGQLAQEGIKVTTIASGPKKGTPNSYTPLSDSDRADLLKVVNTFKDAFVQTVALGRGMTTDAVNKLATGEVWMGSEAVDNGLIDSIGSIKEAYALAVKLGSN